MSDFENMRKKHRKDSMMTLSFLIFILLLFIFDDYFRAIFEQAFRDPGNLFSLFKQSWVKFSSTIVIPFVSYFLGILTIAKRDFYYIIDDYLFKQRKEIDKFICLEMINFRGKLNEDEEKKIEKLRDFVNIHGKSNLLMELFYKYIEKQEIVNPELKNQAFIYWGDYFSSITFIFFGVCILIGMTIASIASCSFSYFRLFLLLAVIFLILLNLYSIFRGKTAKKLFWIPATQINQIHRKAEREFLDDLRAENFGIGP